MSRALNQYLVAAILPPIPANNPKDIGRYVEVQPLGSGAFVVGEMATFFDRQGKKISGRVETPFSLGITKDYEGQNFLVDSFAVSA